MPQRIPADEREAQRRKYEELEQARAIAGAETNDD